MVPAVRAGNSAEKREKSRSLCGLAHTAAEKENLLLGLAGNRVF